MLNGLGVIGEQTPKKPVHHAIGIITPILPRQWGIFFGSYCATAATGENHLLNAWVNGYELSFGHFPVLHYQTGTNPIFTYICTQS